MPAEFTAAVMRDCVKRCKIKSSARDGERGINIDVRKIETDLGWFKFKECLWAECEATYRVIGVSIIYVIAPVKPMGGPSPRPSMILSSLYIQLR